MTICFPATNRVHLARQKLLLRELEKHFSLNIIGQDDCVSGDLLLIRGDRYELLPIAVEALYKRLPIVHLEGGDLSGAIDNKIRHAITQLADLHFATNEESQQRIIQMGIPPSRVFNFGSLDVEFAKSLGYKRKKKGFVLVVFHPVGEEDPNEIKKALEDYQGSIISIKSNQDEGRMYGDEEYPAEEYIKLLAEADVLIGNSSSFLKEASIFGTPVINVGERQRGRLKPKNVIDVPCQAEKIIKALNYQFGQEYEPDYLYYQPDTSKKICQKILEFWGSYQPAKTQKAFQAKTLERLRANL